MNMQNTQLSLRHESSSRRWPRLAVLVGVVVLTPAVVGLVAGMLGLFSVDRLALGAGSGLRTLAAIAVCGCLLAAAGCWKLELER